MSIPTSGEVKFVINFNGEGNGETGTSEPIPSPASPKDESGVGGDPINGKASGGMTAKLHLAMDASKTLGMQALNASVSNIGLATGNYYEQQKAQQTIQGATQMMGLVMSLQNPFTAAISIASLGISSYFEIKAQNKQREIENYQAEQYARRLGFTVGRK